jgi:TP901 family phage tail tape measure protein
MGVVANLVVRVTAATGDFDKQIASLEKSFDRTGSKLQSIGSKLTTGLTLPIVAIAGAAVKAAVDFEDAFSGVAKTVDGVAEKNGKLTAFGKELEQGFRNLAKTIPVSVGELAKIGEAAGAMGIEKDKVLGFTEVIAKLAATTDLTADQAAMSVGKIQGQYGKLGTDTDRFASSLVALGNAGKSFESTIVRAAERMSSTGVQAKISQDQLLGWASAIADISPGGNIELTTTAWQKMVSAIDMAVDLGGGKLQQFAAIAELPAAAFQKLWNTDSSAALLKFVEGLGQVEAHGGNLTKVLAEMGFKTSGMQTTLKALAATSGEVGRQLLLSKDAWQKNNAMQEEFTKKSSTVASMLKILFNRIYDVGIELGRTLIPALMRLAPAFEAVLGFVVKAVQWFSHLPTSVQTGAIAFVAMLAAIGPVTYAIGTLITTGGALVAMLRTVGASTAFSTAIQMITPYALGARMALGSLYAVAAAHPFVAITAAVVALGYALNQVKGAWDNAVMAKQQGGWKAVIGELGRNANNDDWSLFKSWRVDQQQGYKNQGGGLAAQAPTNPLEDAIKQAEAAQDYQKVMDKAAKMRPDLFKNFGDLGQDKKKKPKKTDEQREAEAYQKELDKLSGREAIASAQLWLKKVADLGGVTKLAADDQVTYNKALNDAFDAYKRLGTAVDPKILAAWAGAQKADTVGPAFATSLSQDTIDTNERRWQAMALGMSQGGPGLMLQPSGLVTSMSAESEASALHPSLMQSAFGGSSQFGGDLAATAMSAITGGGNIGNAIGGFLGQGLGKHLSKILTDGIGVSVGGMMGGALNAVLPGIGSLVGPLLGKVVGGIGKLFGFGGEGKKTKKARNEWIDQFGGMEKLQETADKVGFSLDKMLSTKKVKDFEAEVKGLDAAMAAFDKRLQGIDTFTGGAKTRIDAFAKSFSGDKTGQFGGLAGIAAEMKKIDSERSALMGRSLSGSEQNRADELDKRWDELNAAKKTHFTNALGGDVATVQQEFAMLGTFAGAAFAANLKEHGLAKAMESAGPMFEQLLAIGKEQGFSLEGSAAQFAALYQTAQQFAPVIQSLEGLTNMIKGAGEAAILDQQLFSAFGQDAVTQFTRLSEGGVAANQIMAFMQPTLQALWEAQHQFGFATDASTQAMIDQGVQAGLVGANMRDVNKQILDVLISIADVFGAKIPDAMRGLPAVAQEAAAGINNAFGGVQVPGFEPAEDGGYTGMDVPQLAKGGIVPARAGGTLVNVGEGGEAEAVVPLSRMGGVNITLNAGTFVHQDDVGEFIVNAWSEAVRLNRNGSYQRVTAAQGNA